MTPEQSPLGKPSSYTEQYDASLLFPIARKNAREQIGIGATLPFFGTDIWNAYELSWLNARGKPQIAIATFYIPAESPNIVESKSFKLYLGSFRNVGAFHEDCTVAIGKKLVALLKPKFLRIGGYWYPRGGIPIDVFWQTGKLPANVWLPDQGVAPYRARG